MSFQPNSLTQFLGHLHPLWVHLPIGGLVLLGVLELIAGLTRWKDAAQNNRWILGFVSGTMLFSAACGWMLAQSGDYDRELLNWHRGLGVGLTGTCLITFGLRQRGSLASYRVSLTATLGLLVVVSHLGGSMTHGRDFLTRYAPIPFRALGGLAGVNANRISLPSNISALPIFTSMVTPILQQHCYSCHGPEKHKAGLRLDSYEALRSGGQDGLVVRPGDAKNSPLVQCLLSSEDADGHMPPEGQVQLTADQIAILKWWIETGAPAARTLDEVKLSPDIERLLKISRQPVSLRD